MSKPFNILTKSDYAELSTKETDVMYIITEQNQVSSVEVNSKSLIDYIRVKFYDPTDNNKLLSVVRGRVNEKLIVPTVEPTLQYSGTTEKRFMAFANWSLSDKTTINIPVETNLFPTEDSLYYVHRSQLKIIGTCEIVIQGDIYVDQTIVEKIILTFCSSKVYIKETTFNEMTFVPKMQFNNETNENYISFHIINFDSSLATSEGFEVIFKIYSDEKCTKLIGEFPLKIKVTISNESVGD